MTTILLNFLVLVIILILFNFIFFRRNHEPVSSIYNETKKNYISQNAVVAATFFQRTTGLLNHALIAEDEALWITPARILHTKAMRFPIDIVFLNKRKQVTRIFTEVPPTDSLFKYINGGFSSHSAIELRAGSVKKLQIEPGDQFIIN